MSFPIYSVKDHLAAGSMASFQQDELIKVLLAHEASNLSGTMLEQLSEGKFEIKELEEQIPQESEEQLPEGKLEGEELEEQTTEIRKLKAKELEEQIAAITKKVEELEKTTTDLEKTKELEEQQAELDSALVEAVLSQLPEQKSFKNIPYNQLPHQEVKGTWFEQLASEQQLIQSSLRISSGNFIVKYAAFKKEEEELYQSSFSESTFSTSSLQTSLAYSMQLSSLFSKSFTSMKEHQLHLQALAFGSQEPSASTGACKRTCRHDSSLLYNQKKKQEKQLDKELLQREFWSFSFAKNFGKNDFQLSQRAEGRSHDSFRQLPASSFTGSSLPPAACQQSSLTATAFSSLLLRSSFEQL